MEEDYESANVHSYAAGPRVARWGRLEELDPGDEALLQSMERRAKQIKPLRCQVGGCTADLSQAKKYFQRYRICERHLKAPSLKMDGRAVRFCDQCSKFHDITAFEGTRRTCTEKLEKTRQARVVRRMRKGGGGGDEEGGGGRRGRRARADAGSDGGGGGGSSSDGEDGEGGGDGDGGGSGSGRYGGGGGGGGSGSGSDYAAAKRRRRDPSGNGDSGGADDYELQGGGAYGSGGLDGGGGGGGGAYGTDHGAAMLSLASGKRPIGGRFDGLDMAAAGSALQRPLDARPGHGLGDVAPQPLDTGATGATAVAAGIDGAGLSRAGLSPRGGQAGDLLQPPLLLPPAELAGRGVGSGSGLGPMGLLPPLTGGGGSGTAAVSSLPLDLEAPLLTMHASSPASIGGASAGDRGRSLLPPRSDLMLSGGGGSGGLDGNANGRGAGLHSPLSAARLLLRGLSGVPLGRSGSSNLSAEATAAFAAAVAASGGDGGGGGGGHQAKATAGPLGWPQRDGSASMGSGGGGGGGGDSAMAGAGECSGDGRSGGAYSNQGRVARLGSGGSDAAVAAAAGNGRSSSGDASDAADTRARQARLDDRAPHRAGPASGGAPLLELSRPLSGSLAQPPSRELRGLDGLPAEAAAHLQGLLQVLDAAGAAPEEVAEVLGRVPLLLERRRTAPALAADGGSNGADDGQGTMPLKDGAGSGAYQGNGNGAGGSPGAGSVRVKLEGGGGDAGPDLLLSLRQHQHQRQQQQQQSAALDLRLQPCPRPQPPFGMDAEPSGRGNGGRHGARPLDFNARAPAEAAALAGGRGGGGGATMESDVITESGLRLARSLGIQIQRYPKAPSPPSPPPLNQQQVLQLQQIRQLVQQHEQQQQQQQQMLQPLQPPARQFSGVAMLHQELRTQMDRMAPAGAAFGSLDRSPPAAPGRQHMLQPDQAPGLLQLGGSAPPPGGPADLASLRNGFTAGGFTGGAGGGGGGGGRGGGGGGGDGELDAQYRYLSVMQDRLLRQLGLSKPGWQ
ncbi:hypothetical protein HXX76_001533 [Chlamydomonas incerta]|uniref:SBP-type domain-containing protein n=1 Tax=Chlamydomonas incerta TaxID=51695 RepID=A0A835WCB4_CHLIN|nr:hypothetical protein HXX76_001533 [Chlamydomonas incerta]|eukprot:KAG2444790.1 hypothetical protein HXX76_001533 [Chlamydomonas incerta]